MNFTISFLSLSNILSSSPFIATNLNSSFRSVQFFKSFSTFLLSQNSVSILSSKFSNILRTPIIAESNAQFINETFTSRPIFPDSSNVYIDSCIFYSCCSTQTYTNGGAIYVSGQQLTVMGSTFIDCHTLQGASSGGSIYSYSSTSFITRCCFTQSSAHGHGQSFYISTTSSTSITTSSIYNCNSNSPFSSSTFYIMSPLISIQSINTTSNNVINEGCGVYIYLTQQQSSTNSIFQTWTCVNNSGLTVLQLSTYMSSMFTIDSANFVNNSARNYFISFVDVGTLSNCVFVNNSAEIEMFHPITNDGRITFINCVIDIDVTNDGLSVVANPETLQLVQYMTDLCFGVIFNGSFPGNISTNETANVSSDGISSENISDASNASTALIVVIVLCVIELIVIVGLVAFLLFIRKKLKENKENVHDNDKLKIDDISDENIEEEEVKEKEKIDDDDVKKDEPQQKVAEEDIVNQKDPPSVTIRSSGPHAVGRIRTTNQSSFLQYSVNFSSSDSDSESFE